ncbi:hypothetical protein LCGC14_1734450 [marine sediment metagenome]|uniref:Uncharacterized protein n=1 Tax=marine sediment metagenome TaxID=412755 RepID=A0A0F9HWB1_9ZZZZ
MLTIVLAVFIAIGIYLELKRKMSVTFSRGLGSLIVAAMLTLCVGTFGFSVTKQNDNYVMQIHPYLMRYSLKENGAENIDHLPYYLPYKDYSLLKRTIKLKALLDTHAENEFLSKIQIEQAEFIIAAGDALNIKYLDKAAEARGEELEKMAQSLGLETGSMIALKEK